VTLSSFLIFSVTFLFSCHCNPKIPLQIAAAKFSLTFDNSSITIHFRYWRRTSEGGSLVAVYSGGAPQLIHHNPFRIRRSKRPLPQVLYNPHLQATLECVASKGLTATDGRPQPLHLQHLQAAPGCVANTGLITSLDATLARITPVTPLDATLPKNRGEGMLWLTSRPVAQRFPLQPQPIFQSPGGGISVSLPPRSWSNRFARITLVSR
jgi:hypothetical protein